MFNVPTDSESCTVFISKGNARKEKFNKRPVKEIFCDRRLSR